jgi:GTP-binding protein EngB required for normal cell division
MDNDRPSLDLKHFTYICPDKNGESKLNCSFMNWIEIFQVPVIAVFTKHDQFKRNIKMKLVHEGRDPETELDTEVESAFKQYYLARLSGSPPFVCLQSEEFVDQFLAVLISVL